MATRLNMTAPSGCVSVYTAVCAHVCVMTAAQSLVVWCPDSGPACRGALDS